MCTFAHINLLTSSHTFLVFCAVRFSIMITDQCQYRLVARYDFSPLQLWKSGRLCYGHANLLTSSHLSCLAAHRLCDWSLCFGIMITSMSMSLGSLCVTFICNFKKFDRQLFLPFAHILHGRPTQPSSSPQETGLSQQRRAAAAHPPPPQAQKAQP